MRGLPQDASLSLYLHIPFCDSLCWFCGCHTRVVNKYAPISTYLSSLEREIGLVSELLGSKRRVSHIHWGGGSPTILSPADTRRLGTLLRGYFDVDKACEFAVEIDPRGLKDEQIEALAEAGVNRASIGVQELDPKVQWAINRVQPFATTASATRRLRAAGIAALNIDLMYGLPHQTRAHLQHTIETVLTLAPERFAVFGYAHVPHMKRHQEQIDATTLPCVDERETQFELAHTLLSKAGYCAVGLDHFALPGDPLAIAQRNGTLSRNFQGYTTDRADALIGFGASAIGALPSGYVQNTPDVPAYMRAIEAGALGTSRGVALSEDDRAQRAIIERLMCDLAVDLDQIGAAFGQSRADFETEISEIIREYGELAIVEGGKITVPSSKRANVRLVCAVFDRYLGKTHAVHALAV